MKITTRRDALFASCRPSPARRPRAAPSRRSPASSCWRPRTAIELRATDMEIGLRVPLEGEVVREGSVVLPARLVVDVVRALPGDRRLARAAPRRAGRRDRRRLRDLPHPHAALEDFPPFPEPEGDARRGARARRSSSTVNKVARSASRDETRPVLTGILVSATGDELRMVATDSYRLVGQGDQARGAAEPAPSRPTCRRARCRSSRGSSSTRAPSRSRVSVRANQVVFEAGGVVLSSRLIDGQFPNYRQLLPDAYEHELRLARRRRSPRSCAASRCWRRRTRRCGSRSPRAS